LKRALERQNGGHNEVLESTNNAVKSCRKFKFGLVKVVKTDVIFTVTVSTHIGHIEELEDDPVHVSIKHLPPTPSFRSGEFEPWTGQFFFSSTQLVLKMQPQLYPQLTFSKRSSLDEHMPHCIWNI
jgi:hypothetical protein